MRNFSGRLLVELNHSFGLIWQHEVEANADLARLFFIRYSCFDDAASVVGELVWHVIVINDETAAKLPLQWPPAVAGHKATFGNEISMQVAHSKGFVHREL